MIGRDYILMENDLHPDHFSIKLLRDPYTDVVYMYGDVRLIKQKDHAKLSFKYTIESIPDHLCKDELKTNSKFNNLLGDVLADILSNNEAQIGQRDAKPS